MSAACFVRDNVRVQVTSALIDSTVALLTDRDERFWTGARFGLLGVHQFLFGTSCVCVTARAWP